MNSYFLTIAGSWPVLIFSIVAAAALTWFVYRITVPPISKSKKIMLGAMRFVGLAILIFVLFDPVYSFVKSALEKPKVIVLIDKSSSMAMRDAAGDRREAFLEAWNNAGLESFGDRFEPILFDSRTAPKSRIVADSIRFDGALTDVSAALRKAARLARDENARAVALFTDGSFNTGTNPIYEAENLAKPIYAVGVGDSVEPKDASVQTIIANEVVYFENSTPVNVAIKSVGFGGESAELKLFDNGREIGSQTINFHDEKRDYNAVFEFKSDEEGTHKISASLSTLEGEITEKNNELSEFIKVIKYKKKIAMFAGSPNPDYAFLKRELTKNKDVEIAEFVQKKGSEFYDASFEGLAESEIVIFVGFPIRTTPVDVLDRVEKVLGKGKSLLFIASAETDYAKLKKLESYLPFVVESSNPREYEFTLDPKPNSISGPILKIRGTEDDAKYWRDLPPIYRNEIFVRKKPESEVLATIRLNNSPIPEPAILTRYFGGQKTLAVLGYGIYRWKLLGHAAEVAEGREDYPDLFSIFLDNSLRWLSVKRDDQFVKIETDRKNYSTAEKAMFTAQILDANYDPIETAEVFVRIHGGEQTREIELISTGGGRYKAEVEGFSPGDYAWDGFARVDGNKIGSDEGKFGVGQVAPEFRDMTMNASLLRNMAAVSGGKFYLPADAKSMVSDIKNHRHFKPKTISYKTDFALRNYPWILIVALGLFAAEWAIRKNGGLL